MTRNELFAKMSTKQIIEQFVMTGNMEYTPELPTVRGWYMDELEARDPEAFNAWLDMDAPEDEDLYKFYKVAKTKKGGETRPQNKRKKEKQYENQSNPSKRRFPLRRNYRRRKLRYLPTHDFQVSR